MASLKDQLTGPVEYIDPKRLARRDDPKTSHAAAAAAASKVTIRQQVVLDTLRAHPAGLCDYDLQDILNDHGSTFRTRRAELVERGLVRDSGRTIVRRGRKRIIWVATETSQC